MVVIQGRHDQSVTRRMEWRGTGEREHEGTAAGIPQEKKCWVKQMEEVTLIPGFFFFLSAYNQETWPYVMGKRRWIWCLLCLWFSLSQSWKQNSTFTWTYEEKGDQTDLCVTYVFFQSCLFLESGLFMECLEGDKKPYLDTEPRSVAYFESVPPKDLAKPHTHKKNVVKWE